MGIIIFDPTRQNFWACQNISFVEKKIIIFLTMNTLISVEIFKNP